MIIVENNKIAQGDVNIFSHLTKSCIEYRLYSDEISLFFYDIHDPNQYRDIRCYKHWL